VVEQELYQFLLFGRSVWFALLQPTLFVNPASPSPSPSIFWASKPGTNFPAHNPIQLVNLDFSRMVNVIELTRSTTVCPFRNNLYFASIYGAQIKSGATFICPSKRKHTSRSLKAALLFNPWTLASRANESLPCLLFHLVEDEDVAVLREIRGIGRTSMQLNCCGNSLPKGPFLNAFKACRESM
jgi:hypothetical protein